MISMVTAAGDGLRPQAHGGNVMNALVRGRRRSTLVGLALLLGSLAGIIGSAHVLDAAPRPVTAVSAADTDPGDPVNWCYLTRSCQQ